MQPILVRTRQSVMQLYGYAPEDHCQKLVEPHFDLHILGLVTPIGQLDSVSRECYLLA